MTQEELQAKISNITDSELAEMASEKLRKLCKTGGKSFTMSVPVRYDDDDMIFMEVIKRLSNYASKEGGNHE